MKMTFKVDDKEVKVGQDMRVEVDLEDGTSIVVVLTNEGVITDCFDKDGENIATSSIMYDERFSEMTEE